MCHKAPHRIDVLGDHHLQIARLEEPGQGTVPGVWLGIPHLGVALDLTAPVHRSLTPAGAPLDGLKPAGEGPFRQSPRGGRLSLRSVSKIVLHAAQASGVTKRISPHSFCHAMATHLLRNQADLRHIQSTELYTHLALEDLKEAARRSHPHGRKER